MGQAMPEEKYGKGKDCRASTFVANEEFQHLQCNQTTSTLHSYTKRTHHLAPTSDQKAEHSCRKERAKAQRTQTPSASLYPACYSCWITKHQHHAVPPRCFCLPVSGRFKWGSLLISPVQTTAKRQAKEFEQGENLLSSPRASVRSCT